MNGLPPSANRPNNLQKIPVANALTLKAVRPGKSSTDIAAAVKRAEGALQDLSRNFDNWMSAGIDSLAAAHNDILSEGMSEDRAEVLFTAAHDLKGTAATFGYPHAGQLAGLLCALMQHAPVTTNLPVALISQHVDAIKAIFREGVKVQNDDRAIAILTKLREVNGEVLALERKKVERCRSAV